MAKPSAPLEKTASAKPGNSSETGRVRKAIANIKEAIKGYIKAMEEDHLPVPEERFEALLVAV